MSSLRDIVNEKITEENKIVICKVLFDSITDVDIGIKQDLSLVVSQLMGYQIGVFTTSAEAELLCNQNNISEAGFSRLLCNLIVLEAVILLNSSDVNVSDIECKLDYTVTHDVDRVVSSLCESYNRTSGLKVKSINDSSKAKERNVSVGEYNVSLVLEYMQKVFSKLYGFAGSNEDKFSKAINIFNDFRGSKPNVYLDNFEMPNGISTLDELVLAVRDSISRAISSNESFSKSRLMLLSTEVGEGSLKTFDSNLYSKLGRDLNRFFMEGKETTASAVYYLIKIFVYMTCSLGAVERFDNLELEE